jgi:hypothetical protein
MSEWDRQTSPGGVEGPQWVSAAEAADVAGVTPGTVRYWARNGLIVSEVVEGVAGERTLVRLDEVLRHARQEGESRRGPEGGGSEVVTDLPARTSELAPILKSIPEIMAQLTAATDRAARAETKVEFLSAQLADLRRRLAEAEAAGAPAGADPVTLPEAWTVTDDAASVVAEETPAPVEDAPGSSGWPAPPASSLADLPAEPGPDNIDWGTPEPAAAPGGAPATVEDPPEPSPPPPAADFSLDDIWNRPAATTRSNVPEPEPEPEQSDVDWHEPAGAAPAAEPATPTRPANAPVPDGDDFYGPRRRRWFRRRRR